MLRNAVGSTVGISGASGDDVDDVIMGEGATGVGCAPVALTSDVVGPVGAFETVAGTKVLGRSIFTQHHSGEGAGLAGRQLPRSHAVTTLGLPGRPSG